jgi:hypothetical protein
MDASPEKWKLSLSRTSATTVSLRACTRRSNSEAGVTIPPPDRTVRLFLLLRLPLDEELEVHRIQTRMNWYEPTKDLRLGTIVPIWILVRCGWWRCRQSSLVHTPRHGHGRQNTYTSCRGSRSKEIRSSKHS